MKKFISLLLVMFVFIVSSIAQNSISQNSIVKRAGTAADTVKKDTHKYYELTCSPYVKKVAFQVQTTRTAGSYTKVYAVLEKSYDNVKYYPIDSVLIGTATTTYKTKLDVKDVNAYYYRVHCRGLDSTQTNKVSLIILNEK